MNNKVVLYILYAVVIIALGYLAYTTQFFGLAKGMGGVQKNNYQAVFLTNGQVYFGKVDKMNSSTTTLKDIYYLQVQQVQPAPEQTADQSQGKLTLIKLGNEIHGPEDSMTINNSQIVFWENLKNDGKVVDAIKRYQTEGPSTDTSPNSQEVQTSQ